MTYGCTDTVQTRPEASREYHGTGASWFATVQEQNVRFTAALIEESFRAYASLFYAPFSPSRNGSRVEAADPPIED